MKARKLMAVLALGIFFSGAVVDDAMARAGRARGGIHRSTGWRGTRTQDNSKMQGIQQNRVNQTPRQNQTQANRPSWFQRNPFISGMLGALAGTALFAMLAQAFPGLGGFGGGLMMLLLLAGLAMLLMRLFRSRQVPSYSNGWQQGQNGPLPFTGGPGRNPNGITDFQAYRQTREQGLAAIALETPSFTTAKASDELANLFFQVQEAWSAADRGALRTLTAPVIYDEFVADLDDMARRGEHNVIKNLVVRGFEITEAWQDEAEEFITARIEARLIDYVERDGQVVEGSATEPTDFREAWTFARPRRGGQGWLLSAINQF